MMPRMSPDDLQRAMSLVCFVLSVGTSIVHAGSCYYFVRATHAAEDGERWFLGGFTWMGFCTLGVSLVWVWLLRPQAGASVPGSPGWIGLALLFLMSQAGAIGSGVYVYLGLRQDGHKIRARMPSGGEQEANP